MSKNDRSVFRRSDGQWANKLNNSKKASSLHDTQGQAEDAARKMLNNQGGGELTTMGRHGTIVSKDTIGGNDPRSIKDTEH